MSALTLKRVWS